MLLCSKEHQPQHARYRTGFSPSGRAEARPTLGEGVGLQVLRGLGTGWERTVGALHVRAAFACGENDKVRIDLARVDQRTFERAEKVDDATLARVVPAKVLHDLVEQVHEDRAAEVLALAHVE